MENYIKAYKAYYTYIFNILYKKLKNRNDAEDICQEVFTLFYNDFNNLQEKSYKAWLLSVAKYKVLNYNKKNNKVVIENIEDHEYHANMQIVNGAMDMRIILKGIIENNETFKDDEEKILFEMIAVFNYSYKEVEKRLGLSKRQVEYKYEQITKRILTYLKEKGVKKDFLYE